MDEIENVLADVADVKYDDATGKNVTATINGQRWSGITPENRMWADVMAYVSKGGVIEPYAEPAPDLRTSILQRLSEIDRLSIRPMRDGTDADAEYLDALTAEAATLRAELAAL